LEKGGFFDLQETEIQGLDINNFLKTGLGGPMRRRTYFGWLVMLLFAFATLLAPIIAEGLEPTNTISATKTDSFNNMWTVQSKSYGQCVDPNGNIITDSKGNPYPGIALIYDVSVVDAHGDPVNPPPNVVQSSVDFLLPRNWEISWPDDRSAKVVDCDTSSKWRCDDSLKDVISWNSLKWLPNLHAVFSVCIKRGGVAKKAQMLLETDIENIEFGNETNGYVLGPTSCTETISSSERLYGAPANFTFGGTGWDGSLGNVKIKYDSCSGTPTGSVLDPDIPKQYGTFSPLYVCTGTFDAYARNTCHEVKRAGWEDAFLVYANHIIVGYGTQFWIGPEVIPPDPFIRPAIGCTGGEPLSYIALEDAVYVWYRNDGTFCDMTSPTSPYDTDNSVLDPNVWLWVCVGNVSSRTCSVVYDSPLTAVDGSFCPTSSGWPWCQ
jgi:hypothetical protein